VRTGLIAPVEELFGFARKLGIGERRIPIATWPITPSAWVQPSASVSPRVLAKNCEGSKASENHFAPASKEMTWSLNWALAHPHGMAVVIAQAENLCPECVSNENRLTGIRSHAPSATTS
jgi:hypothetical protein